MQQFLNIWRRDKLSKGQNDKESGNNELFVKVQEASERMKIPYVFSTLIAGLLINSLKVLYIFSILVSGLWIFIYSLFIGVSPPILDKNLLLYLFLYLPLTISVFFMFLILSFFLIKKSENCPNVGFQSSKFSRLFYILSIISPGCFVLQTELTGEISVLSIFLSILFVFPALLSLAVWCELKKSNLNQEKLGIKCFFGIFSRAFGFVIFVGGQLYFSLFLYILGSNVENLIIVYILITIVNILIVLTFRSFVKDILNPKISFIDSLKNHLIEYGILVLLVIILVGKYIIPFPFYLSKSGFVKAKFFEKGRSQPTEIFLLWRTSNWIVYKVITKKKVKKKGKEIEKEILSEDVFMKALSNDDYIEFIPAPLSKLYELFSSSNSSQQKANSQSSGSQKTSKGGHQSQIQAERGQKGLQGKRETRDQHSLSSHRRKTSESAGSGEKRRQSKTYTRRQPDTVGQRE